MGYWHTNSGKRFKVNLDQDLIKAMKDEGACFCWFKDNPGINDENNETFYMTEKDDEDDDETRVLREDITVTTENGQIHPFTGYVLHWVENSNLQTAGTDIQKWFIFQPGKYPTSYIISSENEVVVTDL